MYNCTAGVLEEVLGIESVFSPQAKEMDSQGALWQYVVLRDMSIQRLDCEMLEHRTGHCHKQHVC